MDLTTFTARLAEIETAREHVGLIAEGLTARLNVPVMTIREELKALDAAEAAVADLLARLKADLSQPEPTASPVPADGKTVCPGCDRASGPHVHHDSGTVSAVPPPRAAKGSVTEAVRAALAEGLGAMTTADLAAKLGLNAASVAKARKKIAGEDFRKMVERKGREQTAEICDDCDRDPCICADEGDPDNVGKGGPEMIP